jgi:hypothetical protein
MTNIRHSRRQWIGGDSRGVCEQKIAEDDHYPPVPSVERGGTSREVCEQETAEDDHYPPLLVSGKGDSGGVYEQEAAEDDQYPPLPSMERGDLRYARSGFANKRPPRATIIRQSAAVESGNPRRVPEKETGEGDYYPRLAPLGKREPTQRSPGKGWLG